MQKKISFSFILACVFTCIATIALVLYGISFVATVQGYLESVASGDVADGLQAVFGMVFCLIFFALLLATSTLGLPFAVYSARHNDGKLKTASTVLWIVHAAYLLISIVSFIILVAVL